MFTGEALALVALWISRRFDRARAGSQKELEPLLAAEGTSTNSTTLDPTYEDEGEADGATVDTAVLSASNPAVFQPVLLIPTLCDLLGTTLAGIGLLYVYASTWQMLRGSIIIFTGGFSVVFLKRRLRPYHYVGMTVVLVGLVMVGLASMLAVGDERHTANAHSGPEKLLGMAMIVAAQVVSASQMVFEERLLKHRRLPPMQVVGMEGAFGWVIMALVVLPALYFVPGPQPSPQPHGSYENTLDAAAMVRNNHTLLTFCLLYLFSITAYNICGLAVTKSLSAV